MKRRFLFPAVLLSASLVGSLAVAQTSDEAGPLLDPRVREGGLLSQWLQRTIQPPYTRVMTVFFSATERFNICDEISFKRKESVSLEGAWEVIEAKIRTSGTLSFDLKAASTGSSSSAYYSLPTASDWVIHFSEPTAIETEFALIFQAKPEEVCVNGGGGCVDAPDGATPLFVVGYNTERDSMIDLDCVLFKLWLSEQ